MNVYIVFLINLVFNPGNFIISGFVDVMLVWLGFHLSLLGLVYVSDKFIQVLFKQKRKDHPTAE